MGLRGFMDTLHFRAAIEHLRAEEWIAQRSGRLHPEPSFRRAWNRLIYHRALEYLDRSELLILAAGFLGHLRGSHAEGQKDLPCGCEVRNLRKMSRRLKFL